MNTKRALEIAGGSTTGHAHLAAHRNNQDAFAWIAAEDGLVAVVCDGCGSGQHSEVGAQVGARSLVQALQRRLGSELSAAEMLEHARLEVLAALRGVAEAMSGQSLGADARAAGMTFAQTVTEYFLFTVVGVLATGREVVTFSLGDGLVVLNGERRELGPFPNNEPPYLGYALLSQAAERRCFEIQQAVPLAELRSVLLGSDGALDLERSAAREVPGRKERVGAISQFWTEDRFFVNRDQVRRRLAVLNRRIGEALLADDTTLVVVRSRESVR